jgi:Putative rhamnosyl transferase
MVLTHFVITRFSYVERPRAGQLAVRSNYTTGNPLTPYKLDRRFKLFELLCLPGMLGQTTKNFTWVFVIDPALPNDRQQRLRDLTTPHPDVVIVEFTPGEDLGRLRWLLPYVRDSATTHIATTNIDDDDLVSPRLLESAQRHFRQREAQQALPPCTIVCCTEPRQWDFMPTREAPLGYVKPWGRGVFPDFGGYTVCCKHPGYDFSALAFAHTGGAAYFDPDKQMDDATQARLRAAAERAGDDWKAWRPSDHMHILDGTQLWVVTVNHLGNDQVRRLFERWSTRRAVRGASDFPGMIFEFDRIAEVIRDFRRSPRDLMRLLGRGVRLLLSSDSGRRRVRKQVLYRVLTMPIWFMFGLPEKKSRRS